MKNYLFVVPILCLSNVTQAQRLTSVFFDDFSDGIADGWVPLVDVFPGHYDASSGDYELRFLEDRFGDRTLISYVSGLSIDGDVSVRGQGRSTGPGGISVLARFDSVELNGYYANVDFRDRAVELIRIDRGGIGFLMTVPTSTVGIDSSEDVIIQLDVIDEMVPADDDTNGLVRTSRVELRAWRPGDPEPDAPLIAFVDDTYASGGVAVGFNEDPGPGAGSAYGIFRYIDVAIPGCDRDAVREGRDTDCDANGIPDTCEASDCNGNGVADRCDIAGGVSVDFDMDGVPDECQPKLIRITMDNTTEVLPSMNAHTLIWPAAESVPLNRFALLATENLTLIRSKVTYTGPISSGRRRGSGSDGLTRPPAIVSFAGLDNGLHEVDVNPSPAPGEWLRIDLTVLGPLPSPATFSVWLAHHPGDLDANAVVNIRDATAFGDLFHNDGPVALLDLNGDGVVDNRDATTFGEIWHGESAQTQSWAGYQLPPRPD